MATGVRSLVAFLVVFERHAMRLVLHKWILFLAQFFATR
jgi:hypothetical protein